MIRARRASHGRGLTPGSSRACGLVLGLLVTPVAACAKEPTSTSASTVTPPSQRAAGATKDSTKDSTKDPATARAMIAAGATVIDVRTPEEYEAGHLPGAINLPVDTLSARLADLDALVGANQGAPIVVYCGSGRRAGTAKEQLSAAGYTQVVNGGGFSELASP